MNRSPNDRSSYAVCLPLGIGVRSEPEDVRFDGMSFRCVPFQVLVPGLVEGGYGLTNWQVEPCMIRDGSPLARNWRSPLTREAAEGLILGLPESSSTQALDLKSALDEGSASSLCAYLSALDEKTWREEQVRNLYVSRLLLGELSIALNRSCDTIGDELADSIGGVWSLVRDFEQHLLDNPDLLSPRWSGAVAELSSAAHE